MADFQQKAADLKNAADALAATAARKASRPPKAWCRPPGRRAALATARIGGERKQNNKPRPQKAITAACLYAETRRGRLSGP